jgi:hypothetical protein
MCLVNEVFLRADAKSRSTILAESVCNWLHVTESLHVCLLLGGIHTTGSETNCDRKIQQLREQPFPQRRNQLEQSRLLGKPF